MNLMSWSSNSEYICEEIVAAESKWEFEFWVNDQYGQRVASEMMLNAEDGIQRAGM